MTDRFPGSMRFPDGTEAEVELRVDEETLALRADQAQLGVWPLRYCRVSRLSEHEFELWIDGEEVQFHPETPNRFGLVAAQRFEATSLADRIAVVREIPPATETGEVAEPSEPGPRIPRLWFGLGALVVAAVISAAVLWWAEADQAPPLPEAVPTTTPTTEAPPEVFTSPPRVFIDEWNRTVIELDAPLRIVGISSGPFETELAENLILQTDVAPDGTLDRFVLTVDPSGSPEDDQLAISAFGVAIAVVEPGLDGRERRRLLSDLGLDIDQPDLAGLDGEVETAHARYSLAYLEEFQRLLFTVEGR